MYRLLDQILDTGELLMPPGLQPGFPEYIKNTLLSSVPIIGDSVTKFYYEISDKEHWSLTEDFPNLAPPFRMMFIDTVAPAKIYSREVGVTTDHRLPAQWGILVHSQEVKDKSAWLEQFSAAVSDSAEAARKAWTDNDFRWALSVYPFVKPKNQTIVSGPVGNILAMVTAEGRVVGLPDGQPATLVQPYAFHENQYKMFEDAEFLSKYAGELLEITKPTLLAICFMHCKNVHLDPFKRPRELMRRFERTKNPGLHVHYKTLRIEQMRRVIETEGKLSEHGAKKALHICAGHFKDYRQSGLFGKHKGLYWWSDTVRGDVGKGVVVSEREVSAPESAPEKVGA